ncbi:MAG: hypothetical protein WBA41_21015 [Rivularia sp. (in: cyanobacteria)]
MKFQILLSGFAIASSLFCYIPTAEAEPAAIFKPLIKDIRNQLPKGLSMRLPAYLPASPIKLYPYIESDSSSFVVNITFKPNCSSGCTVGAIAALTPEKAKNFPPQKVKTTSINLSNGIRGQYFTYGNDKNKVRYLAWNQDGQKFAIAILAEATSQKELINIAQSAIDEAPIKSSK